MVVIGYGGALAAKAARSGQLRNSLPSQKSHDP
jgi:hypothetical protein